MKSDQINDNKKDTKKQGMSKEDAVKFLQKNARYIIGAVVLIVLLVVLVKCTGKTGKNGDSVADTEGTQIAGADGVYEVNDNEAISTLVNNYFTAYANGDLDTLATLATPISDNEKSYITMFSQYVESYQSISCYTKQGLDSASYLVSVYLEMKFAGVDTVAPGLDFFYVQTNEDGSLYINNIYSQYNLLNEEQPFDENIQQLIQKFEQQDDVVALQSDVQTKYEAAVTADANLATMVNTTIADAYNAWAATISATTAENTSEQPAATEQPATDAAATEQPAAEQPAVDTTAAPTSETVYALDTVNIRSAANETADVLGSATIGASFTRTATTADGWSQIDYNGVTAFIKSDYLTTDATQTSQSSQTAVTSGTTVRLSDTTNIRSSMSETADRVGVAYAGESVSVVESYAEGWSKVEWNGETGYIKTDLLH